MNELASNQSEFDWKLLLLVIGSFGGLLVFLYKHFLEDGATRKHFIELIENKHWIDFYRQLVKGLLHRLQTWFGGAWSGRAFGVCLALAFLYPFFFFIVAHSLGHGSHEFAGVAIIQSDPAYRIWYLPIVIILYISILKLLIIESKQKDIAGNRIYPDRFGQKLVLSYRSFCAICFLSLTSGMGDGAYYSLFCVFIIIIIGSWGMAVAGVGALGIYSFYLENYQGSLLLLILFFMLPIFNASLDWVSWGFSRHYLS